MNNIEQLITSIGLMSGTSGDGIDISIIQSDGEDHLNFLGNYYFQYSPRLKSEITALKEKILSKEDLKKNEKIIKDFEKKLTDVHAFSVNEALLKLNIPKKKINLVGFHGQTIFHSFRDKISKQIADGKLLSKLLNLDVVYDFRKEDINNGGQGAPLTPIYHSLIQKKIGIEQPVVFINIGGISNLTFIGSDQKLKSFDTGPGNCLIDQFIKISSNYKILYDNNGEIAFKGNSDEIILETYLNDPYYEIKPPKSLDINDFSISAIRGLSFENSVATLSELTSRTIVNSLFLLPEKPKKIILCGGGRKNKFIFERIKKLSKINTHNIDEFNFDGDFIESQAFAYLAIRSFLNKKISFPYTTGVAKSVSGGVLVKSK